MPPPVPVRLHVHEQVKERVDRQSGQSCADAKRVDVRTRVPGFDQVVVFHVLQSALLVQIAEFLIPFIEFHAAWVLAGLFQSPEERGRRIRRSQREGMALQKVHAEQHVPLLIGAVQEVAVTHVSPEARGEHEDGHEGSIRGRATGNVAVALCALLSRSAFLGHRSFVNSRSAELGAAPDVFPQRPGMADGRLRCSHCLRLPA